MGELPDAVAGFGYATVEDVLGQIEPVLRAQSDGSFYARRPDAHVYQGDRVPCPSVSYLSAGQRIRVDHALVVSNTCDLSAGRRDSALVAPILPLDWFEQGRQPAIRDQRVVRFVYLPQWEGDDEPRDFVADFSQIQPLPAEALDRFRDPTTQRGPSLSQLGYHLLLLKLTLFFARPDDRFALLRGAI